MTTNNILNGFYFIMMLLVIAVVFNYFDNRLDEIQDEIAFFNYSDLTIKINNATWEQAESTNKSQDK